MQELRLVAVSEDGSYLVLATAGRGTRFTLPVDDRLRAAVRGHFSRLGQYEIEVESPLRPKEIQARIRAGETAEEIAETAGIPVERVRWFEGPVLQEREYVAQQAQRVTIRRQGESAPAPALGEIVEERLGKRGIDLEEVEWDSRKCEDSTWRVRLSFSYDGRPYAAEWAYDPRRRHISAVNEEAARLSSLELDDPVDDIVTPFVPRRAMKVVSEPVRYDPSPAPPPAPPREEPPAAEETPIVREVPRPQVAESPAPPPEEPREPAPSRETARAPEPAPAEEPATPREVTQREAAPREVATPPRPREAHAAEPREETVPEAPAAERPTAPRPAAPARIEPARPAAEQEPAVREPAPRQPAEHKPVPQKPAAKPAAQKPSQPKPARPQPKPAQPAAAEPVTEQPAAAAAGGAKATPPAQDKRPAARKKSRGKRASVPSWDEIMFGARRPE
jgi:Protein of unknown function (DUF3071)